MRTQILSLMLVLALLVAGCTGAASVQAPQGEPFMAGKITAIDQQQRVLIEAVPGKEEGPKCWLKVSDTTRLLKTAAGGKLQAASRSDLKVGTPVQAWVTGPVLESYPCQGGADALVISQ